MTETTGRLRAVGLLLKALADRRDDWIGPAYQTALRGALVSLRTYLEDPDDEGVTWQRPVAEIRFRPPGEWSNYRGGRHRVDPADWPERYAAELLAEEPAKWGDFMVDLLLAYTLGQHAAQGHYVVRGADVEAIPAGGAYDPSKSLMFEPERVELGPVFRVERKRRSAVEVSAAVTLHHLVIDEDEGGVYYAAHAGLAARTPEGRRAELPDLTRGEEVSLWRAIEAKLDPGAVERLWAIIGEALVTQRPKGDAKLPTEMVVARVHPEVGQPSGAPSRYLLDQPTRRDSRANTLLLQADGLNLPRKWSSLPFWDTLVEDQVGTIRAELGDKAFESGPGRKPLLKRARTSGEIQLEPEGEKRIYEMLGHRPFRRPLRDPDGIRREYLIKRIKTVGGTLEIRLTWAGQAWPLIDDATSKEHAKLKEIVKRQAGRLFDELTAAEREEVDGRLRFIESIRDGRVVMDLICDVFGRDGENPVRIPAHEFYILLGCERDHNRQQRVMGCLQALQNVHFRLLAGGATAHYDSFGPFLGEIDHDPRADGTYFLHISPGFVGSLRIFSTGAERIKDARRVNVHDWAKPLTGDERAELGKGGFVQYFSALGSYYDRAKGFTPQQSRLRKHVETQLTRRKDPIRGSRAALKARPNASDGSHPRVYDSSFCPLLTAGMEFHGALGHFKHNPETGRKLYGTGSTATARSGAATEGLMYAMGYTIPKGRSGAQRAKLVAAALQDMRAVVEEAMGGVVAAFLDGSWYTLAEVVRFPEEQLGHKVRWYLFPAADWQERLRRDFNQTQAKRYKHGETPWLVEVTTHREVYRQAEEGRQGVWRGGATNQAPEGPPLHIMMRTKRIGDKLSQAKLGALFGVGAMAVSSWEKGPGPDLEGRTGRAIPAELVELVRRWVRTGEPPAAGELLARKSYRSGRKLDETG